MIESLVLRVRNEPALVAGLVASLLIAVQEFGLDLTDGQETSLNGLTLALLALVVRRKVTPTHNIPDNSDTVTPQV